MCPTDERERQKSDWHGASVLQKASHLRQLFPTQDGAEHDTLQEMQPCAGEVTEGATAAELRARRQSGCLRALP